MLSGKTCVFRRGLLKCGAAAIGYCEYCGRFFCEQHGVQFGEGEEVCNRRACVAKREDVARHLVYKDAVLERNVAQHCGVEGCEDKAGGRCQRCQGYFCRIHVMIQEDSYLQDKRRVTRKVPLCDHCLARRPIWTRR